MLTNVNSQTLLVMHSKQYLLKEDILTARERKGARVIYTNKHLDSRVLPVVIDCCSIHSFSVKTPQPDLAAFHFLFF